MAPLNLIIMKIKNLEVFALIFFWGMTLFKTLIKGVYFREK